jgi:hypothetical protein
VTMPRKHKIDRANNKALIHRDLILPLSVPGLSAIFQRLWHPDAGNIRFI